MTDSQNRAEFTPDSHGKTAIRGAKTHNLKNFDVEIPHGMMTVVTGVSGSGKSSLVFDTLFAEGQRQYLNSLSNSTRRLVDVLPRPDVQSITGLQPTLCVDQKSASVHPRSTVATLSEIYDFLRLLMARAGEPFCHRCQARIQQQSTADIIRDILAYPIGSRIVLYAPVVRGRKGAHREVFDTLCKAGLVKARVDGETIELETPPLLEPNRTHTIEAICDRIILKEGAESRLEAAVQVALKLADGLVSVLVALPPDAVPPIAHSKEQATSSPLSSAAKSAKSSSGLSSSYESTTLPPLHSSSGESANPAPAISHSYGNTTSSPPLSHSYGRGVGGEGSRDTFEKLYSTKYACPDCGLSYEEIEPRIFSFNSPYGACQECNGLGSTKASSTPHSDQDREGEAAALPSRPIIASVTCPSCNGTRLRPESRAILLNGLSIDRICAMTIDDSLAWFTSLIENPNSHGATSIVETISRPITVEITKRLQFLHRIGLGYLTLDRSSETLSGGELQRVRLGTSLGTGLVGVCYILDEPSLGLHPNNAKQLIGVLHELRDQGNTLVIVEHDHQIMLAADCLIEIGPGAGRQGGELMAIGTPQAIKSNPASITGQYLQKESLVSVLPRQNSFSRSDRIRIRKANLHNLRSINVDIPLQCFVSVSGVSGSGKSTLILNTLVPAIEGFFQAQKSQATENKDTSKSKLSVADASQRRSAFLPGLDGCSHENLELIDRLIVVDQQSIGRNARSTPSTYLGIWDLIREVFSQTREAKQRGFGPGRFGFNSGPGRCEACQGQGQRTISMGFMADVYEACPRCQGARFNRPTLAVRYKDKNIADILAMTVDEAYGFFQNFAKLARIFETLQSVGLGYLTLGQPSQSLSGGEAQRIKIAAELSRPAIPRTLYVLDEPTSGLHAKDVDLLIQALRSLIDRGNSVVVIEHHLELIRQSDWRIDLGPGGGPHGGTLIYAGPTEGYPQV